jgi:hypothetical protein
MLRAIDRFVDLDGLRQHLASFYSVTGRPSIDPELTIRMLLVGQQVRLRALPAEDSMLSEGASPQDPPQHL